MALTRRDFLRTTGIAGVALGTGAVSLAQPAPRRLNILYVMTDQQPTSGAEGYGNPVIQTPALAELARRGCRFDRFYIAGFPCSPSRTCMMSGLYPHHHGVVQNDIIYDPQIPSFGDVCHAAGYDTGYFGKWHLGGNMYRGREDNRARGFGGDWYFRRVESPDGFKFEAAAGGVGEDKPQHGFTTWEGGWEQYHQWLRDQGQGELLTKFPSLGNHNDAPSGPEGTHHWSQIPAEYHMEAFFAGQADRFIRSHAGTGNPWCAVLSFFGPHSPVAPPRPWDEKYTLEQAGLPPNHYDKLEGKPITQRASAQCYMLPRWNDGQFMDYRRRYFGYCSYIDHQIGRVFQALQETNQWDNTIVVFTSDHGDMVGAHGMILKLGCCGYEELYRVPTFVHIPGVTRAGSSTDALASNIDFMPTLLEATGLSVPSNLDGKSLLPLLRGETSRHRQAIFSDCSDSSLITRDERHKFVLNWKRRDLDELYDLQSDPGEMTNLAYDPAHKATADQMRKRVLDWTAETTHPFAAVIAAQAAKTPESTVVEMRPEAEKFGYLGGNEFEMGVVWHVTKPLKPEGRYWSFMQFLRGNSGEIAFRATPYPEPPVTEWKAGEDYHVGPVKFVVPPETAAGNFRVRVGLYDPALKKGPGNLLGGEGNARTVGMLTITRQGGKISGVSFKPQE